MTLAGVFGEMTKSVSLVMILVSYFTNRHWREN